MPNHRENHSNHQDESVPESKRLTAPQIFEAATENARSELSRSWRSLAFSGLAGGITLGLTGIGVASVQAILGEGNWQQLVSYLLYPSGFIAVIIGRSQLFTENTLYPVVLVLDERGHLLNTLRLWVVVSLLTSSALYVLRRSQYERRRFARRFLRPWSEWGKTQRLAASVICFGVAWWAVGSSRWLPGW